MAYTVFGKQKPESVLFSIHCVFKCLSVCVQIKHWPCAARFLIKIWLLNYSNDPHKWTR